MTALLYASYMSHALLVSSSRMNRQKEIQSTMTVVPNKALRKSRSKRASGQCANESYPRSPGQAQKLAADIVLHYEALCAEKPEIVQRL